MPETLTKLRPDRDLQCYFERPSAIAALSETAGDRFTVSGTWRQQFDWCVIEWNRDNVFEHPSFRNLPDGDLSGLRLSYRERRTNCMALDCDIYPTVDWPFLRVWASQGGVERVYKVPLRQYATPVAGTYRSASAEFEIVGVPTAGDYIGLTWLSEHHTHQVYWNDTLASIAAAIAASVQAYSHTMDAEAIGSRIRLTYYGAGQTVTTSTTGANGNRIGVYGHVTPGSTLAWDKQWSLLHGGTSPDEWRIDLNFGALLDETGAPVPADNVRKLRWTYAASLQTGGYQRSEFDVRITESQVTGTRLAYQVAGSGSRRMEDDDAGVTYSGNWTQGKGNFSGGSIRYATTPGSKVTVNYYSPQAHRLYLGTRGCFNGASARTTVDGIVRPISRLLLPGEDTLQRIPMGDYAAGQHTVTVEHAGAAGEYLYFDFIEIAIPADTLPANTPQQKITLATDWDTDHSIALAPERTAWQVDSLGFRGRANHYTGALWFYELVRDGHQYASVQLTFAGTPEMSRLTELTVARAGDAPTLLQHLNLAGDTSETIALAFALEINRGYTGIRAIAQGNTLTIYARAMGAEGNRLGVTGTPAAGEFRVEPAAATFSGGIDGEWHTDLRSSPRVNRAARDWSRSYFRALANRGIEVTAAFSMELQHGDTSPQAGVAQRYPDGAPALLNTPALQTNFSPASTAYWKDVYRDMARVQSEAGVRPYLQFGEVQWWYFPRQTAPGMPFYDDYARQRFREQYGREMGIIAGNAEDPALYPDELQLLRRLIGEFTTSVIAHVRTEFPTCRFEVLYPPDVNETALNDAANYPVQDWTPATLDCLKTENFTYTYSRNLDASYQSMTYGQRRGFPISRRSHLVGISDPIAPWRKEAALALGEGAESVVLFALDQFCLIGYALPLDLVSGRSGKMG
ncbi:MAG TPA: hypothetical protein VFL57_05410 [Bryobacteraceae bacterium]|nr:hypothetical protein [Bryobacteraceae bacterium]